MFTPALGSPFGTGEAPYAVAFSPDGTLLATSNCARFGVNGVSVFSVGSAGALSEVAGSPFATGICPFSVTFSADGKLLATANTSDTVSVFSVTAGGVLTPVAGSPFATAGSPLTIGMDPLSVAFSPDGKLLATADNGEAMGDSVPGAVSLFSVGAGGTLTPVSGSPFVTGTHPYSVAFSPNGGLLAVTNPSASTNTVSVFSVSAAGALTPVSGSPFATGVFPASVAFSPDGVLLATANVGDRMGHIAGSVSLFSVSPAGSLTPASGSPFATGWEPSSVAFSSNSKLLATANRAENTMSVFSVKASALTPVSGSPFATGDYPQSVAFGLAGNLLATADTGANTVSVFFHDTTPPVITGPGDLTAKATSAAGAIVTYTVRATDPDSPVKSLVCDPRSGSMFPVGSTIVNCTASDPSGNTASISLTVTVKGVPPPPQLQHLLTDVRTMPASIGRLILSNDVNEMINNVQTGRTAQVCSDLNFMQLVVQAWSGGSLMTTAQANTILADINQIIAVLGCNTT